MRKILKYFPVSLLVVYLAKSFIVQPSFFDFGVIALMSGLFLYTMKIEKREVSEKEELNDIIAQLEAKVNERMDNLQKKQDNDRLAAENKFSTLNMGIQNQKQARESQPVGWGR